MQTDLRFFHYPQISNGGVWCGPTRHVLVQAATAREADALAEMVGVRFNDCDDRNAPDCGGWLSPYGGGQPAPSIYGRPIAEGAPSDADFLWDIAAPVAIVRYADGNEARWTVRDGVWSKLAA